MPAGSPPPPTSRVDVVGPMLSLYADEASRALTRDGRPVKHTFVSPTPVAHDRCCEGMVYSRIETVVPQTAPTPEGVRQVCEPHGFTLNLAVGVLRCASTIDSRGRPPSAQRIADDGLMQADDLQSLKDAILGRDETRALGTWTPIPNEGGCVGGEWLFSVRVDNLRVPVPEPEPNG